MPKEKLAIIVATKDRPKEMGRLLADIASQDVKPVKVIIVDGGRTPIDGMLAGFKDLALDYIRKIPASLTAQRNAGVQKVGNEATLVAFLDDDVLLEKESFRKMMDFWESAGPDTGAAMFNNMAVAYSAPSLLESIFMVNSASPGRVMRSGFQSGLCSVKDTAQVEWLGGYAMVYRKKVFDEFGFDEWFSGYARYEDVDFSYRVGKKYRMFVVADARINHMPYLEDVSASARLGRMEVVNRLYFVGKNPELSAILCYWALSGIFINNLVRGAFRMDRRYLNRALGNLSGFMEAIFKRHK